MGVGVYLTDGHVEDGGEVFGGVEAAFYCHGILMEASRSLRIASMPPSMFYGTNANKAFPALPYNAISDFFNRPPLDALPSTYIALCPVLCKWYLSHCNPISQALIDSAECMETG